MGTLYLVSTPIGNLEDITLRALRVLSEVDIVLCEDTRETRKLMRGFSGGVAGGCKKNGGRRGGGPKLVSYNDYNRDRRIPWVIGELKKGRNAALVADRGTPLIADPGYKLVREVLRVAESDSLGVNLKHFGGGSRRHLGIEVIPGASAAVAALVVSGLPPDKFMFVGFLPKKTTARIKLFKSLPGVTVVAFEAPYRLTASLKDLREAWGEAEVAVCVELTKMYERVFRGKVSEVLEEFLERKVVKGEVTLVFRVPRG